MMYDIYEIRLMKDDDSYDLIEKIHQPSEPMYDSNALINVIKRRVATQQKVDEDDLRIVNVGQSENIGGEAPTLG